MKDEVERLWRTMDDALHDVPPLDEFRAALSACGLELVGDFEIEQLRQKSARFDEHIKTAINITKSWPRRARTLSDGEG